MKSIKYGLATLLSLQLATTAMAAPTGQDLGEKWCSDVKMHFYAGGPEAGGFAGIVAAGAMNAIRDTGADAEILYSEWDFEKMVRQLRESIGLGVDAIAMMGHPGNDALMPLAKQADAAGDYNDLSKCRSRRSSCKIWRWLRWCQSGDPRESVS